MITHFLTGVGIVTLWVLSLVVHPFGRCWLCLGKGNLRSKRKGRAPKCWACRGIGRRQRLGSQAVHRIRRTAVAGWRARKDRPA